MRAAMDAAASVHGQTSPNPWVGAVLVDSSGSIISTGATAPPGGPHAEVVALDGAGDVNLDGAVLVVTLEPCGHHGRTPPCVDRIIERGVRRVVIGAGDPDPAVNGRGVQALREAGVDVVEGVLVDEVSEQLAAYLHHRRTGRPYVVLKMAGSIDGRVAAPDGTSVWITGDEARCDVHRLRAQSDAVVVGSGTVGADDPQLTVRDVPGRDPRRIVLGAVPSGARVNPCEVHSGDPGELLNRLGDEGVLQVLVEGGPTVAAQWHGLGLIDRYVIYIAPAIFGGNRAREMFAGHTAATMADLWRGRLVSLQRFGDDVRVDIVPVSDTNHGVGAKG